MWVSNKQFILSEWDAGFGPNNLSTHNVNGEGPLWFYKGSFTRKVFDTTGSRVVLDLSEFAAADSGLEQGVYLLPRYGGDPTPIITGQSIETETLAWSATLDQFVVGLNEEVVLFDRQGNITQRIERGGEAYIAPNGKWLALYSEDRLNFDLFTSTGEFLRQLFKGSVEAVLWSPSSEGIFYVSEDDLYHFLVDDESLMSGSDLFPFLIKHTVPDWEFYYHWVRP
jgi:hypothetical protein